jgi:hypothetical protein
MTLRDYSPATGLANARSPEQRERPIAIHTIVTV